MNSESVKTESVLERAPTIRERLMRHAMARLLVALVVLFVSAPFLQKLESGRGIEALLLSLVLAASVMAVGGRRRTFVVAIVLALPVIFGRWLLHFIAAGTLYKFLFVAYLAFNGFVIFHLLRFILRSRRVNSEVICAAVSNYLLMGLLWAWCYALMARLDPGAITGLPSDNRNPHGFEAMYFSMITLTTVGYGDIVPVSSPARMLAMLEAVCGTMYMAVLVARLVSVYSASGPTDTQGDQGKP